MTQPASVINYGTDLASVPNPDANGQIDLTSDMAETSGLSVLAQSIVRRQTTPHGSVIDCPNDCIDVRDFLSAGMTPVQLQAIPATIKNELLRDERVLSVNVQVTYTPGNNSLKIVETIFSSAGPFRLTLDVSKVTLTVLQENL